LDIVDGFKEDPIPGQRSFGTVHGVVGLHRRLFRFLSDVVDDGKTHDPTIETGAKAVTHRHPVACAGTRSIRILYPRRARRIPVTTKAQLTTPVSKTSAAVP
jgi:hypothetical protein